MQDSLIIINICSSKCRIRSNMPNYFSIKITSQAPFQNKLPVKLTFTNHFQQPHATLSVFFTQT